MKRLEAVLDQVLEQALGKALASLEARATAIVEESLGAALEARLKALLGEPPIAPEASARAKAKAAMVEATPTLAQEGATPKAPRRRKAKAQAPAPAPAQEDLESILEGVRAALQKYSGITTPRGKVYSDVLLRRVRKVLEHAQENGHDNLALLARSALAHINVNPKEVAMSSWQYLAGKLGLPVPISQA